MHLSSSAPPACRTKRAGGGGRGELGSITKGKKRTNWQRGLRKRKVRKGKKRRSRESLQYCAVSKSQRLLTFSNTVWKEEILTEGGAFPLGGWAGGNIRTYIKKKGRVFERIFCQGRRN